MDTAYKHPFYKSDHYTQVCCTHMMFSLLAVSWRRARMWSFRGFVWRKKLIKLPQLKISLWKRRRIKTEKGSSKSKRLYINNLIQEYLSCFHTWIWSLTDDNFCEMGPRSSILLTYRNDRRFFAEDNQYIDQHFLQLKVFRALHQASTEWKKLSF